MKTMLRKKVILSMISDIYLARNRSIMRISAACSCHIGKRRKNNEDNFFFAGRYMASCNNGLGSILEKNYPLKKDRFFAVFDGMGGGEYGEIASYMGAKATEEYLNAEEADDIFSENKVAVQDVGTTTASGTLATGVIRSLSENGNLQFSGSGAIEKDDGQDN